MRRLPLFLLALLLGVATTLGVPTSHAEAVTTSAVTATGSLLYPASTYSVTRDMRYSTASSGKAGLFDVYAPSNGRSINPTIIWVHGGGWIGGDKTDDSSKLLPLVKAGYVVVSINYRLANEARWPAQIIDVKTAVRAVRANASRLRVWPDKIGIAGGSAGGHLAAIAGLTNGKTDWVSAEWPGMSSRVTAALDDYGPTDLPAWVRTQAWPPPSLMVNPLLGGSVDQQPEKAADASPVTWVSSGAVPFFVRHGTSDTTVPASQSVKLRDLLQAAGVPVTSLMLSGAKHADAAFYTASRMAAVAAWFDGHLRP